MDAAASAIADPTRREILMLLRRRTMSAGEIAGRFDVSRPAISRHLRVLRESGLVVDDVRGRQRIYRLSLTPLEPLEAWLAEMRDVWSGPLDALETEVYRTRRERRESAPRESVRETRERQPKAAASKAAASGSTKNRKTETGRVRPTPIEKATTPKERSA